MNELIMSLFYFLTFSIMFALTWRVLFRGSSYF